MKRAAPFLLILVAAIAQAEDAPMSGPEFRAASEGHTLYFETLDGEYFGAEQYFEDNRSVWLPRQGQCIPGVWAAAEDKICFLHYGEVACWRIYGENGEVTHAAAADQGDTLTLRVVRRDRSPVLCPDGPGV